MTEMTPDTRPLSQRMLLDGMYPGIVEKWACEVAALEARNEAAEKLMDKVVTEGYGWGGLGFRAWKDDYAKWREVAALAAKEKPCPSE